MAVQHEISDLRKGLTAYLKSSFIGPEDSFEVLSGGRRPHNTYLTGAIYSNSMTEADTANDNESNHRESEKETESELANEYASLNETANSNEETADEISKDLILFPSSAGLTIYTKKEVNHLPVSISFGIYKFSNLDESLSRTPHDWNLTLDIQSSSRIALIENWAFLDIRVRSYEEQKIVTLTLINKAPKELFKEQAAKKRSILKDISTLWQCKIEATLEKSNFLSINSLSSTTMDNEVKSQVLLYRDIPIFGVGHNCSATWEQDGPTLKVSTDFIPEYELFLMKPSNRNNIDLSIDNFITIDSLDRDGIHALKKLSKGYDDWIAHQASLEVPPHLKNIASIHIDECKTASVRIGNGIKILENNTLAKQAFVAANTILKTQNEWKGLNKFNWHPFQICFFLQNLLGLTDETSTDRSMTDLLWFPTGGGKTEAYLLIAAFLIVYRNLREEQTGKSGGGTAVILRYTLRLLTQQQLQRAARMICAAEYLRSANPSLYGKSQFSIGLWVGGDSFPNDNSEWQKRRDEGKAPLVFESCPCCNSELSIKNYKINHLQEEKKRRSSFKRLEIKCDFESCKYKDIPLPIHLTDEDVYKYAPSILIGTVDKFAQIAWHEDAGKIFNIFSRHCVIHGYFSPNADTCNCKGTVSIETPAPELIIQDELHLITGPLGSMVGAFEIAVRNLCSRKGIKPKYIASTATIRGASKQLFELYNTPSFQFPPPGINHDDSYFAKQGKKEDNDMGRLYLGVSAKGRSGKLVMARLYGLLNHYYNHHFHENTFSKDSTDYLRTVIGYFNSRKELGGVLSMMGDDVLKWRKFHHDSDGSNYDDERPVEYPELKGGMSGERVTKILNSLEQKKHSAPEFVLSTNILSVGIDISRLFSMVIAGQPKTTSEYIQASSRVGRSVPGLVITNFNWSRPRDVSHYERFLSYHCQLYRYVEGISVTPLSPQVRIRTVAGILVALVRNLIPEMRTDDSAKYFQRHKSQIEEICNLILSSISPNELKEDFEAELREIVSRWDIATKIESSDFKYRAGNKTRGLLKAFGPQEIGSDHIAQFVTSLRNVDEEVPLQIKSGGW